MKSEKKSNNRSYPHMLGAYPGRLSKRGILSDFSGRRRRKGGSIFDMQIINQYSKLKFYKNSNRVSDFDILIYINSIYHDLLIA